MMIEAAVLSALAAAGRMAVADGIDGRDMQVVHEGPAVPVRQSNEQSGLHHGDKVGVANDVGLAAGRDNTERLKRFTVEQFPDRFSAHAPIVASGRTATQTDAHGGISSHGVAQPLQTDLPALAKVNLDSVSAKRLDDLDRRVIEALAAGETIRLSTATAATPGVPVGWMAASWRRRLNYLADACEWVNPSRAAELREQAAGVELTTIN